MHRSSFAGPLFGVLLGLVAFGPTAEAQGTQVLESDRSPERENGRLGGSSYWADNTADDIDPGAPIANALASVSDDVREFNDHLTFLAHPFLAGRMPGTQGMEIAKDYMEFYLASAGLEPAFPVAGSTTGEKSFRQPFELAGESKLVSQALSIAGLDLEVGTDWSLTSLGEAGAVEGPLHFVGYGIGRGPRGEDGEAPYTNLADDLDLTGKIAVVFRFEPMTEDGVSLWGRERDGQVRWSPRTGLRGKLRSVARAGAAGILLVNPPGCSDLRAEEPVGFDMGDEQVEIPVVLVSRAAGERLAPLIAGGRTLFDLRRHADSSGLDLPLDGSARIAGEIEIVGKRVENVGGVLPGVGALRDQWLVMGGHLDHLGMGVYGTRFRGELHPGADDNATGAAGVIMLARMLRDEAAKLSAGTPRRSILFIGFTAEEAGLHGAHHYVAEPLAPLAEHSLMCNFDMVGRIVNKRLLVAGAFTGTGLPELLAPVFERSSLDIVQPDTVMMASDHASFYRADVPVLFSITADLNAHKDYHTPRDVAWKINRVDAVEAVYLYRDVLAATMVHPARIEFSGLRRATAPGSEAESAVAADAPPARPTGITGIKVRFGIAPGNYDDADPGVVVASVSPSTSAEAAGIEAGDRLMTWDGDAIQDISSWMQQLAQHAPGDVVRVGLVRGGEKLTLPVELFARE
ncbi:MAG: M28 family peptidase [Planctomycetota bacterium]